MKTFDLDHIEQLGGLDADGIQEILIEFLDELDPTLEDLVASLDDRETFRAKIHSLKGAALMSGFAELGEMTRQYEAQAQGKTPLPKAEELRKQMEDQFAKARRAFSQAVESLQ